MSSSLSLKLKPLGGGLVLSSLLTFLAVVYYSLEQLVDEGAAYHESHRQLYESDNGHCLEEAACRFTLGLFLLAFSPLLIYWNEHQFVRITDLYRAAKKHVKDLVRPAPLGEETDGQFVCFSGTIKGGITLVDNLFPSITMDNALLLKREIEIYQHVTVSKGNKKTRLEQKWCNAPQKDPGKFPNVKNNNGNWHIFSNPTSLVSTGDTLHGEPIEFGDNIVVFRAPSPTIGAFALPPALMNEAFFGERNVQRLAELERIKSSQGKWVTFDLNQNKFSPRVEGGLMEQGIQCYRKGAYVYDGGETQVGTIRMRWHCALPQTRTIAAEAVAPGRRLNCRHDYSTPSHNIKQPGVKFQMILSDLNPKSPSVAESLYPRKEEEEEETQALLHAPKGDFADCLLQKKPRANNPYWSVTPFPVTTTSWFSGNKETFLGELWLSDPGIMDSNELFISANRASSRCLWKTRGLSYIALFVGWCLVFEPLTNIVHATFLEGLFSLAFATVAFVLATACCLSVTAVARFVVRPFESALIVASVWAVVLEASNILNHSMREK